MPTTLERLPFGARIVVIRLRSMGDCVLTTPALRLLKQHRPDLRVAVVVEERFRAIFENSSDVQAILDPVVSAVATWKPLLALNLHGGSLSMALTVGSLAEWRAGFAHHFWSAAYNLKIPSAQEILGVERRVHTAEHLASAMFYLGVPVSEIPRAKLGVAGPPPMREPYAVIHPFASAEDKAWPLERFFAVAEFLRRTMGLESVFLAGPDDDVTALEGREVFARPLAEVKTLISGASLFVGNDSGPAHVAAAFGLPVVALFPNSDPVIWAPWRTSGAAVSPEGGDISVQRVIAEIGAVAAAGKGPRET